jgi:hypothetical protein
MVSSAQVKQLEPLVRMLVTQETQANTQRLASLVLEELAGVKLRQLAIETILISKGVATSEEIKAEIVVQEDKILGYEPAPSAQENDLVRLTVSIQTEGEPEQSQPEKIRIQSLNRKINDRVQSFAELEAALVGASVGTSGKVVVKPEEEGDKTIEVSYTVDRVSRKVAK